MKPGCLWACLVLTLLLSPAAAVAGAPISATPQPLLVLPLPWRSHTAGLLKVTLGLVRRGHHVTVIVPADMLQFAQEYLADQASRLSYDDERSAGDALMLVQYMTYESKQNMEELADKYSNRPAMEAVDAVIEISDDACQQLMFNSTIATNIERSGYKVSHSRTGSCIGPPHVLLPRSLHLLANAASHASSRARGAGCAPLWQVWIWVGAPWEHSPVTPAAAPPSPARRPLRAGHPCRRVRHVRPPLCGARGPPAHRL